MAPLFKLSFLFSSHGTMSNFLRKQFSLKQSDENEGISERQPDSIEFIKSDGSLYREPLKQIDENKRIPARQPDSREFIKSDGTLYHEPIVDREPIVDEKRSRSRKKPLTHRKERAMQRAHKKSAHFRMRKRAQVKFKQNENKKSSAMNILPAEKNALIIINVQSCYLDSCRESGETNGRNVPGSSQIISKINRMLTWTKDNGDSFWDLTLYTKDSHPLAHISFQSRFGTSDSSIGLTCEIQGGSLHPHDSYNEPLCCEESDAASCHCEPNSQDDLLTCRNVTQPLFPDSCIAGQDDSFSPDLHGITPDAHATASFSPLPDVAVIETGTGADLDSQSVFFERLSYTNQEIVDSMDLSMVDIEKFQLKTNWLLESKSINNIFFVGIGTGDELKTSAIHAEELGFEPYLIKDTIASKFTGTTETDFYADLSSTGGGLTISEIHDTLEQFEIDAVSNDILKQVTPATTLACETQPVTQPVTPANTPPSQVTCADTTSASSCAECFVGVTAGDEASKCNSTDCFLKSLTECLWKAPCAVTNDCSDSDLECGSELKCVLPQCPTNVILNEKGELPACMCNAEEIFAGAEEFNNQKLTMCENSTSSSGTTLLKVSLTKPKIKNIRNAANCDAITNAMLQEIFFNSHDYKAGMEDLYCGLAKPQSADNCVYNVDTQMCKQGPPPVVELPVCPQNEILLYDQTSQCTCNGETVDVLADYNLAEPELSMCYHGSLKVPFLKTEADLIEAAADCQSITISMMDIMFKYNSDDFHEDQMGFYCGLLKPASQDHCGYDSNAGTCTVINHADPACDNDVILDHNTVSQCLCNGVTIQVVNDHTNNILHICQTTSKGAVAIPLRKVHVDEVANKNICTDITPQDIENMFQYNHDDFYEDKLDFYCGLQNPASGNVCGFDYNLKTCVIAGTQTPHVTSAPEISSSPPPTIPIGQKNALLILDVQSCYLDRCGISSEPGALSIDRASEIIPKINRMRQWKQADNTTSFFDFTVFSMDSHPENHISFASTFPGKNAFHDYQNLTCNIDGSGVFPSEGDTDPACCTPETAEDQCFCFDDVEMEINLCRNITQQLWPEHCMKSKGDDALSPFLDPEPKKIYSDEDPNFDNEVIIKKGEYELMDAFSVFFENVEITDEEVAGALQFLHNDKGQLFPLKTYKYLKDKNIDNVFIVGIAADYQIKNSAIHAQWLNFTTYLIKDASVGVYPPDDTKPNSTHHDRETEHYEEMRNVHDVQYQYYMSEFENYGDGVFLTKDPNPVQPLEDLMCPDPTRLVTHTCNCTSLCDVNKCALARTQVNCEGLNPTVTHAAVCATEWKETLTDDDCTNLGSIAVNPEVLSMSGDLLICSKTTLKIKNFTYDHNAEGGDTVRVYVGESTDDDIVTNGILLRDGAQDSLENLTEFTFELTDGLDVSNLRYFAIMEVEGSEDIRAAYKEIGSDVVIPQQCTCNAECNSNDCTAAESPEECEALNGHVCVATWDELQIDTICDCNNHCDQQLCRDADSVETCEAISDPNTCNIRWEHIHADEIPELPNADAASPCYGIHCGEECKTAGDQTGHCDRYHVCETDKDTYKDPDFCKVCSCTGEHCNTAECTAADTKDKCNDLTPDNTCVATWLDFTVGNWAWTCSCADRVEDGCDESGCAEASDHDSCLDLNSENCYARWFKEKIPTEKKFCKDNVKTCSSGQWIHNDYDSTECADSSCPADDSNCCDGFQEFNGAATMFGTLVLYFLVL